MTFRPICINERMDLIRAVKAVRRAHGYSGEALDHVVGLTRGHTVKIENPEKPWGKVAFSFSTSLAWILEALGLRLVLMSAEQARELVGMEVRQSRDAYWPKDAPAPLPIRPASMVIYEWKNETPSPPST